MVLLMMRRSPITFQGLPRKIFLFRLFSFQRSITALHSLTNPDIFKLRWYRRSSIPPLTFIDQNG